MTMYTHELTNGGGGRHGGAGAGWEGGYQLVPEPLLVAIDMGEITIR